MNNKSEDQCVQNALEAVAKENGISVESVRREIAIAIAAARENKDPAIQAFWASVEGKDEDSPRMEDVLVYIVQINKGIAD